MLKAAPGGWRSTPPGHGQTQARLGDGPRPNNKRGAAKADSELAKLVAQVETGRTMPTSGMTVEQLIERYVDRPLAELGARCG